MTELMDAATGIEYLKLHSSEVHGVASKPEKPKKPVLDMAGSCVDSLDWEAFCHKFKVYKFLIGCSCYGFFLPKINFLEADRKHAVCRSVNR